MNNPHLSSTHGLEDFPKASFPQQVGGAGGQSDMTRLTFDLHIQCCITAAVRVVGTSHLSTNENSSEDNLYFGSKSLITMSGAWRCGERKGRREREREREREDREREREGRRCRGKRSIHGTCRVAKLVAVSSHTSCSRRTIPLCLGQWISSADCTTFCSLLNMKQ